MSKENEDKSPQLNQLLDFLSLNIGQPNINRSSAKQQNKCCKCGGEATKFKDELSRKEYGLTGWCQSCQDDFFGG